MTDELLTKLQTLPVSSTDDLTRLWRALIGDGGFASRTLWLAVLDDDARPVPVLVPIEDIPRAPAPSDLEAFKRMLAGMLEFGSVIMLLSRPGTDAISQHDRRWAAALSPLAPSWPVHLATGGPHGRPKIQLIEPASA